MSSNSEKPALTCSGVNRSGALMDLARAETERSIVVCNSHCISCVCGFVAATLYAPEKIKVALPVVTMQKAAMIVTNDWVCVIGSSTSRKPCNLWGRHKQA